MTIYSEHFQTTSLILSTVPHDELRLIRPFMTRVRLVPHQSLIDRGETAEHAFFIEEGIVSLVAEVDEGVAGVQVAMIGREGMVGALALLGASAPYACAVVQVPGPAIRISVANLLQCFEECPTLKRNCMESIQTLTRQIMSTAVSNARNTLVKRCVRWLLMTHDRIGEDELPITHEALSAMLGVRRSGVTVATVALQDAGLIRTGRGRIRVVDRKGLEAVVSEQPNRLRRRAPGPVHEAATMESGA